MNFSENDKLDCLIQLAYWQCAAKDAARFDETDGAEIVVPKRLDRKVKRLIDKNAHERKTVSSKRILGRIAIAAMLIMSVMFTILMSVTGIREAIWRAIVEWHENYITIRYEKDTEAMDEYTPENTENNASDSTKEEDSVPSLENNESIIPPTSIEEVRKPTYVIEGAFEDTYQNKAYYLLDYYVENDLVCSFTQFVINDRNRYFDNETAIVKEIYINDYSASLVTYSDKSEISIVWSDKEYVYVLFSSVMDIEQLTAIAESVKPQ